MRPGRDTEWGVWWPCPIPARDENALVLATVLGSATQGGPNTVYTLFPPSTCHLLAFASALFLKRTQLQEMVVMG